MGSKIVLKKWFQRVPKWTPKVDQNRQKGWSGGAPKRDLKKVPSPGSRKVKSGNYLLHFSTISGVRKGKFLGTILESILETKSLKTGFQNSIKKSAENRHPFYEILGPFWGPFLSKKSVVCRSKMSLTCGPLKIVILAPSGHPKSIKFEVIFWWRFDRFSDDGDKQCIRINALFSTELMLFQQFCCSVVGGY